MKRQPIEETKYFFNEYLKSKGLETFEDFEIFCDKMMWDDYIDVTLISCIVKDKIECVDD